LLVVGAFTDFVLGVHILAVVIAFGATFAYPLILASARRADPSVMPWVFSLMRRVDRYIVNPGLTLVLIAGIVLATSEHRWGDFFVAWGIGAAFVIGAIVGSFMIPREGKLVRVAQRDLAAASAGGGSAPASVGGGSAPASVGGGSLAASVGAGSPWSSEYDTLLRQVSIGAAVLDVIVVVTIFMMATHA
jgi:hypothetical protein